MLEPTGPLPASVYWRRRAGAAGGWGLAGGVLVWLVGSLVGGDDEQPVHGAARSQKLVESPSSPPPASPPPASPTTPRGPPTPPAPPTPPPPPPPPRRRRPRGPPRPPRSPPLALVLPRPSGSAPTPRSGSWRPRPPRRTASEPSRCWISASSPTAQ